MSSISSIGQRNPYAYYPAPAAQGAGDTSAAGGGGADSGVGSSGDVGDSPVKKSSPEDEFLNFAKMSLPEKIRYQFLAAHGLTEDDLKAMDDKERQKIEDQIRQEIEEAVKKETDKKAGGLVNITA